MYRNDYKGLPDCPHCGGEGYRQKYPNFGPPVTYTCECVKKKEVLAYIDKAHRGLSNAADIEESPLTGYENKDLWVTSDTRTFMEHLRHVGINMGAGWRFKFVGDGDLPRAWFAHKEKYEIRDVEMAAMDPIASSYEDLVEFDGLLIVQLGVRRLNFGQLPEAIGEMFGRRERLFLPSWLVDQPTNPFQEGHKGFQDENLRVMEHWDHIDLTNGVEEEMPSQSSGYISLPAHMSSTKGVTVRTEVHVKLKEEGEAAPQKKKRTSTKKAVKSSSRTRSVPLTIKETAEEKREGKTRKPARKKKG